MDKPKQRPWNQTVNQYVRAAQVSVHKNCFAYQFTNIGDTVATVNGMRINPSATPATSLGDSRSMSGHKDDIYSGNLTVSFIQPIGANPAIEIIQLYYSD